MPERSPHEVLKIAIHLHVTERKSRIFDVASSSHGDETPVVQPPEARKIKKAREKEAHSARLCNSSWRQTLHAVALGDVHGSRELNLGPVYGCE